jgi:hypothetical protein
MNAQERVGPTSQTRSIGSCFLVNAVEGSNSVNREGLCMRTAKLMQFCLFHTRTDARAGLRAMIPMAAAMMLAMSAIHPTPAFSQSTVTPKPTCVQPPGSGSKIVPTRVFPPIVPRHQLPTISDPLRPGITAPLTILTFGDSAMWGNGLEDHYKYAHLVARDIADDTGRTVNLVSYAHSGANIFNESNSEYEPLRASDHDVPPGDLNAGLPTTLQQEVCAVTRDDYRDAEIVLLDGCINDVGAEKIALPFPLSGLSVAEVKQRTHQWCSDKMLSLLQSTKENFTSATVVVSNYWLIVSDKSSPIGIAIQKGATPDATPIEHEMYRRMKGLLTKELEAEEATGEHLTGSEAIADPKSEFQKWGDNSRAFLDTSQRCFDWAIAFVDGKTNAANGSDDCPSVANVRAQPETSDVRIFLATVSDDPKFSYGAPKKRLWSVPLGSHIRADQLYGQRSVLCRTHYPDNDLGDQLVCKVNPTAHPNVKGAEAYRESIMTILRTAWAISSR